MTSITLPSVADLAKVPGGQPQVLRRFTARTPAGERYESWVKVDHKQDPKLALQAQIGEVPDDLLLFSRILVAIYVPPIVEQSAGGVWFAPKISDEDRKEFLWQGKVGLVVKKGPQAFVDDDEVKFHGQSVDVGDWVWFRPSDGMGCDVNNVPCRMFTSERHIIGKLPHPDMVA